MSEEERVQPCEICGMTDLLADPRGMADWYRRARPSDRALRLGYMFARICFRHPLEIVERTWGKERATTEDMTKALVDYLFPREDEP